MNIKVKTSAKPLRVWASTTGRKASLHRLYTDHETRDCSFRTEQ